MDDILGWKASILGLQKLLDALLPKLAVYGLHVQPAKCQLLCVKGPRNEPLVIEGQKLFPMPEGESLFVMNLPLGIDATETRLLEYLIDKSRKKFWGIIHVLTSRAPLGKRMALLNKVVFGAMRWTIGALFPTVQAQQMINYFQLNCVRKMMGIKRGRQELWVDYEAFLCGRLGSWSIGLT